MGPRPVVKWIIGDKMRRKRGENARHLDGDDVIASIFEEMPELGHGAIDVGADRCNEAQKDLWKLDAV